MTLETLRLGSKGDAVEAWQYFLLGFSFYNKAVDGDFGPGTLESTKNFQRFAQLKPDGVVARDTYAAAMRHGFNPVHDDNADDDRGPGWPKVTFQPLTVEQKHQKFGRIEFKLSENAADPEAIVITNDWVKDNISSFKIPQLVGVVGAGSSGKFLFHKDVGPRVQQLFQAWEDAGHKSLVLTYAGSFVPRLVRGSRTTLSSHAWGTAFDINAAWNARGTRPALVGEKGSVRELVEAAHKLNFFWGGHFNKQDGMHFESI